MAKLCRNVWGVVSVLKSASFEMSQEQSAHAARGEAAAELVEEHRREIAGMRLADLHPAVQGADRVAAQRRDALLAALASYPQHVRIAVPVLDVHTDDLGDSQAGRINRLQDGPVAQPHRLVGRRCFQELGDLNRRQEVRQLPPGPRRAERLGRIARREPFAAAEAKERAETGEPPGDGRFGVLALVQVADVSAKDADGDFGRVGNLSQAVLEVGGQDSRNLPRTT